MHRNTVLTDNEASMIHINNSMGITILMDDLRWNNNNLSILKLSEGSPSNFNLTVQNSIFENNLGFSHVLFDFSELMDGLGGGTVDFKNIRIRNLFGNVVFWEGTNGNGVAHANFELRICFFLLSFFFFVFLWRTGMKCTIRDLRISDCDMESPLFIFNPLSLSLSFVSVENSQFQSPIFLFPNMDISNPSTEKTISINNLSIENNLLGNGTFVFLATDVNFR